MPRAWSGGHEAALSYHQRMLADPHRLDAYERAIRALVRPGDVVLDLGAGTGILSLLAARRGARVHAVESMPVAELAREVVRQNGFADRIVMHCADIRTLQVVEPVDLVVSDFMGRFVFDDCMLEALAAARRWLKPDAGLCPERVTLHLAPAAIGHFAAVDDLETPVCGFDFSAVREQLLMDVYGVALEDGALLCEPQDYYVLRTMNEIDAVFERTLVFEAKKSGRLRGVAGWFEAQLAPGITLSSAPGIETHWYQLLFPVPALQVRRGDVLRFCLSLDARAGKCAWRWRGALERRAEPPVAFAYQVAEAFEISRSSPVSAPALDIDALDALNRRGAAAFAGGDYEAAAQAFQAALAGLSPAADAMASDLYENLGLAYVHAGFYAPAVAVFLHALNGDLSAREQSARFLVDACFRSGRLQDGTRYLAAYEANFGAHPAGWKPVPLGGSGRSRAV